MSDSAELKQPDVQSVKGERKRRGTNPPFLRLSDAVDLANKINERAAGSATYDLFSQITGNTKTSSSFVKKVGALRMYGIIEDTDNIVALSEVGRRITHPVSEIDDALAIKDAMLRIEVLNKIYERHRGRLLPEDQYLTNILVQELRIDKEVAPQWVDWFKDAARTARLLHARTDGKTQVLDGATAPASGDQAEKSGATNDLLGQSIEKEGGAKQQQSALIGDRVIPIPLGLGRLAKVELPRDWDSQKDLSRLLKMLKLSLSEGDVDVEEKL